MRYHPPVGYDPEEIKWEKEQRRFNILLVIVSVIVFAFALGALIYGFTA